MIKPIVYLGLGSNLGNRRQMLVQALLELKKKMTVEAVSSIYETSPQDNKTQPMFLNAVCRISTSLGPHQLLTLTQGIENQLGRECNTHNKPRPIDIDILMYNDLVMQNEILTIPHPLMLERAFVLVPLAEIAPELIHPVAKKSMKNLAGGISRQGIVGKIHLKLP